MRLRMMGGQRIWKSVG